MMLEQKLLWEDKRQEFNPYWLVAKLSCMQLADKVAALNIIRAALHEVSPFFGEPVDCVLWVKNTTVFANDYNPNSVAPTEMKLLELSILQDGYATNRHDANWLW